MKSARIAAQSTRSPKRHAWNASASFVTGSHSMNVGAQMTWGTFIHTYDFNGDLYQRYRSNSTGVPSRCRTPS